MRGRHQPGRRPAAECAAGHGPTHPDPRSSARCLAPHPAAPLTQILIIAHLSPACRCLCWTRPTRCCPAVSRTRSTTSSSCCPPRSRCAVFASACRPHALLHAGVPSAAPSPTSQQALRRRCPACRQTRDLTRRWQALARAVPVCAGGRVLRHPAPRGAGDHPQVHEQAGEGQC